MTDRQYTSAQQRLRALPEVFTGSDLTIVFGWKSATASTYLALWRKAGLVQSLGGRSDVHMNLVQNGQANPEQALRRAYPRAIKVGLDVLRQVGWTTQIPSSIEVALPKGSGLHQIDGFHLQMRSEKWYDSVAPGLLKVVVGIDQLQPAWALADMLARAEDHRVSGSWLLDPEDIDMDLVLADKQLAPATKALGIVLHTAADYEHIYAAWSRNSFEKASQGK